MAARDTGSDLLDRLGRFVEARPTKAVLVVLIVVAVLPYREVEDTLRPLFLFVFGLEVAARLALLWSGRVVHRRTEYLLMAIDVLAFSSFLPLEVWLGLGGSQVYLLRLLRLTRLLLLVRLGRELVRDVFSIVTRREQLQQFALVGAAVVALTFIAAVLLSNLDIPHDYDGDPQRGEGFLDRIWWSFRQVESADNLVENLRVHPLLAGVSLALTVMGVFVVSFVIGVGANIVGQVVRAERHRPISYRDHTVVVGAVQDAEILIREFVRIYAKNLPGWRRRPGQWWAWLVRGGPKPRRRLLPRIALLGVAEKPPDFLFERGMRWVVYREGDGADQEPLEVVGAARAQRAIILARQQTGHDADAITLASLAAFRTQNRHAHVFVELLESDSRSLVQSVGGPGTFALDVHRFLGLFLSQHLVLPGVESIFADLLTAEGSELYTHIYVDPAERDDLEVQAARHEQLPFDDMARCAHEGFGVQLVGVFLGRDPVSRLPGGLVPVDSLVQWLNPTTLRGADEAEPFVATAGQVPLHHLRGLIALAPNYESLLGYSRALVGGEGCIPPREQEKREGPARWLAGDLAFGRSRAPRRVLVMGYSPAVGPFLEGLSRAVADLRATVLVSARPDARTSLTERLGRIGMGLESGAAPGPQGREVELERGGRATVFTHEGPDLASFAVQCIVGHEPMEAAVFLSDPESPDRDARTLMRALRFARALSSGEVSRAPTLHVLAEFVSLDRAERLRDVMSAERCGFGTGCLDLTLVSTEQIKNYFMVHSAFVPGINALYERLLDGEGQELMRLGRESGGGEGEVTMLDVRETLLERGSLPVAVELGDGRVLVNPEISERFAVSDITGVYVLCDSDRPARSDAIES